jgi:hypothetical protein
MYDPREHARLAAIISRRRKQVVRLEEQLVEVRQRLAPFTLVLRWWLEPRQKPWNDEYSVSSEPGHTLLSRILPH